MSFDIDPATVKSVKINTDLGLLKQFINSDKYWPKDYVLYDVHIEISGDEDITCEFEGDILAYVNSLPDTTKACLRGGFLNYEMDDQEKPMLGLQSQFMEMFTDMNAA